MGMNGSQLDRRVQFLRMAGNFNQLGATGAFLPHGDPVAAWRRDVSDAEKLSAGRQVSEVVTRFRVRSSAFTRGLTAADRLTCEGVTFAITGIKQGEGRADYLEITALSGGL